MKRRPDEYAGKVFDDDDVVVLTFSFWWMVCGNAHSCRVVTIDSIVDWIAVYCRLLVNLLLKFFFII